MHRSRLARLALFAATAVAAAASPSSFAVSDAEAVTVQRATPPDRSGQPRVGKASYYHPMFNGRKMANGERFDPNDNNAASKTLPLGTTARVTNLANGRSAVVEIEDRGPYVAGRIVDLSPSTARQLGIGDEGVVPVEVAPIAVPQPDGRVLAGAGARAR
jgi:rare lipoprotein A